MERPPSGGFFCSRRVVGSAAVVLVGDGARGRFSQVGQHLARPDPFLGQRDIAAVGNPRTGGERQKMMARRFVNEKSLGATAASLPVAIVSSFSSPGSRR